MKKFKLNALTSDKQPESLKTENQIFLVHFSTSQNHTIRTKKMRDVYKIQKSQKSCSRSGNIKRKKNSTEG